MTTTPITLEQPFIISAVVEKPDGQPPYLAEVSRVLVPFGHKKLDVTALVLADADMCRQLEDMVMKAYQRGEA